ncbi:MAG: N-formylglutamate amidohydrolase [Pseudomonadota bacterium]
MTILKDCAEAESPFHVEGAARRGRFIVTCDHATNRVPPEIGTLGLPDADMARHIAYDIGALGVARWLGELLEAPVISSNFSRLVIDPNRGEDDPTLIMQLYDGSIIPANKRLNEAERQARLSAFYRPYDAILAAAMAAQPDAVLVSIHSFTPQLNGKPRRPWEVGILHAHDARFSRPLIEELKTNQEITVGVNEPYVGHLPGDAVDRHALRSGRHNTLIELRNDLITSEAGQRSWAELLRPPLEAALKFIDAE